MLVKISKKLRYEYELDISQDELRASLNVLMAIGWSIESVDGKIIAGFCEACGVLLVIYSLLLSLTRAPLLTAQFSCPYPTMDFPGIKPIFEKFFSLV